MANLLAYKSFALAALLLGTLSLSSLAQPPTQPPAAAPWGGYAVAEPGEQTRLPPAQNLPIYDPAIRLAEAPSLSSADPFGAEKRSEATSLFPPGTRKGFFQKLNLSTEYLPRFENDSLGITSLGANVVFGVPFPKPQTPLLITPEYRVRFLDGPDFTDVPTQVHEASIDFHHFRKWNDHWLFDAAVTLGVYADEDSLGDDDAFRVTGRAIGIYDFHNGWKGILGVVYLNRANLSVVPAVGLMFDSGDTKIDLVFPRPRIAWRLPGSRPPSDEHWVYLSGELGGNIWAVKRASGIDDNLSYGDARVLIGYERKMIGDWSTRYELGYVFNRELEYDSEGFESELDDTLFVRAAWAY